MRRLANLGLYILIGLTIVPSLLRAAEEITQTFTLSGTLYQSGTSTPLHDPATKFTIQIISPDKACLLYEEQQTANVGSTGYFSLQVGSPKSSTKRTANDPKHSMASIFQNTGMLFANNVGSSQCPGSLFIPTPGDTRYIRVTVTPSSTNSPDTLTPDIAINSTPSAFVAQSVQGLERNKILQVKENNAVSLSQGNLEWLFSSTNLTNLQTVLSGGLVSAPGTGVALPHFNGQPINLNEGTIWYDTNENVIKFSEGGAAAPLTLVNSSKGTIGGQVIIDTNNYIRTTNAMYSPYIYGSTQASGNLRIESTSDATKGNISIAASGGKVGLGTTSPTAKFHLMAGSATAGTAPMKFTQGPLLTTPEAGAIEFDGSNVYFTDDTATPARHTLATVAGSVAVLQGDVTTVNANTTPGTYTATVQSVGGSTAAQVHQSQLDTTAATASNTASTIVKRDGSGNVSLGDTSLGKLYFRDSGSNTVSIEAPTTVASSYNLKWPATPASALNKVLASDLSGNLSWIDLGAANGQVNLTTQVTGVLPIANGGTNSSTALTNNQLMVSAGGKIVELGAMGTGQLVVGKTSEAPQIVTMGGDVVIDDAGQTTINNVKGTQVSGVGLANKNLLQNTGSTITIDNLLISNATGVQSFPATGANVLLTTVAGIPTWSAQNADNFTQYVLLDGRSSGQTIYGGADASGNLTLESTKHATKGAILLSPAGGSDVAIGTATPLSKFTVAGGAMSAGAQGTGAGQGGEVRFYGPSNGNYVGFRAPDGLGADKIWTLPTTAGTQGQVLQTDNSGNLSWGTVDAPQLGTGTADATTYLRGDKTWQNFNATAIGSTLTGYTTAAAPSSLAATDSVLQGIQKLDGNDAQFLKHDGSRALTGNWNAGAFTATFNSVAVGSAANTISGLSTIINIGTLTLPTSTDTLVGRATTDTLTNKTLSDSTTLIANDSTPTKQLGFDLTNQTASTKLTLTTTQSTSQSLAFPNVGSGETLLTDKNTTTITNKSIDAAANTITGITNSSISDSAAIARSKIAVDATAKAGLVYNDATSGELTSLAAAAAGKVLMANGTTSAPSWQTPTVDGSNVTGLVPMSHGGTNANLTADNGAIVYSSGSALSLLASTATAGLPLLSGANGAPTWSTINLSNGNIKMPAGKSISNDSGDLSVAAVGDLNMTASGNATVKGANTYIGNTTSSSTTTISGGSAGGTSISLLAAGGIAITAPSGMTVSGPTTINAAATAKSFIPTDSDAPTNGIYLPSANTVGIAAGSQQAAQFGTTASSISTPLGIGTTSPTSMLHTVASGAKTSAYTGSYMANTATSSTASIAKVGLDVQSTGSWSGSSATNTGLNVNVSGGTTNYAATFTGGNVGIGTTTPTGTLQISHNNTATTGNVYGVQITPTYNQTSGNAANTDLLINRTETAVGSGPQKLIDAQVGGTSKFSVDNSGNVTVVGVLTAANISGNSSTASNLANGAAGSIPYQSAASTTQMLAIGSTGNILTVNAGLPAWTSTVPVASGGTGVNTITGIIKGNGTSAFTAATAGTDYSVPANNEAFTGAKTFDNDKIILKGSSTGTTTFHSNNSSATDYTLNFPAANDTLLGRNTTDTLTNKTLSDSTTTVANVTDATKKLVFSLGGQTASTTLTLTTAQSTSQSLAVPNVGASDSIVTNNTTATLKNKTINVSDGNVITGLTDSAISGTAAITRSKIAADTGVKGGVIYNNASDGTLTSLTPGTAGVPLISGGTDVAPGWSTVNLGSGNVVLPASGNISNASGAMSVSAATDLTVKGATNTYVGNNVAAGVSTIRGGASSTVVVDTNGVAMTGTTVSAPNFVPNGSTKPTNGMYLPAADTVGFSAGGTLGAQFTSSAASVSIPLGVGTTSPTSMLHTVASGAKTAAYTGNYLSNTATSSTGSIAKIGLDVQSTGTWNGSSATNTGLNVNVSGGATNYAATFTGGNVGIGTTTPTSLLTVTGGAITAGPQGTSASQGGEIRFNELAANGSNYVGFRAPDTLSADKVWTLPSADGTSGQLLQTDGSGALSWGSVNAAQLGTGTADATTYLRGDKTWQNFNAAAIGSVLTNYTTAASPSSLAATDTVLQGLQKLDANDAQFLKIDGSRALTGNWNAGAYSATFNSVAVGSAANRISGLSTIVNGSGTLTLPTSTDTIVGRATTDTLTNKTLSDSTTTVANVTDATKKLVFSLGGQTASTTLTLTTAQTTSQSLAFPNVGAGETLLTDKNTATITNKTIDAGSNTITGITDTSISNSAAITRTKIAADTSAKGGVIYNDATSGSLTSLVAGTAGVPLISGGVGVAPGWSTVNLGSGNVVLPASGNISNASGAMSVSAATDLTVKGATNTYVGNNVAAGVSTIRGGASSTVVVDTNGVAMTGTTVSAPNFVPNGSTKPTNGMYLPAADTVGLSAGGTLGAQFTATAASVAIPLGVGTTSPTSMLHTVASGAKTAAYTGNYLSNTATSSTGSIAKIGLDVQSTGTWNGSSATNTGLNVNVSGGATNYAATFTGGNVGIGTTTPTSLLTVNGGAITAGPQGTSANQGGEVRFNELAANGSNYVGFRAPDTLSADKVWTLPSGDGTSGQLLQTDGSGALSWGSVNAAQLGTGTADATTYLRGDKTWQNFNAAAIGSTLTGLSTSAGTVAATDSIVTAIGKLAGNGGLYVKKDGTTALTGNWSAGAFSATFNSVAVGSAANTISGLSTIVNTGTLTLPTSTDTLVGRATTDTLTNKTLSDSTTTVANVTDATKKLVFSLGGQTASTTLTLTTAQSTSQSLAIPNVSASDSLTTNNTTATLKNKTINVSDGNVITGLTDSAISASAAITRSKIAADTSVKGGIIYNDATSGSLTSLTPGASGTVLTSGGASAAPTWNTPTVAAANITGVLPIASGGTNNGSLATTAGGILYMDGSKVMTSAAGTSGQALLSAGSGTPIFGTLGLGAGGTGLTTGTSGGIPYFTSSSTAMTSSAALTQYGVVYGGGAGGAPASTAAGTSGNVLVSGGGSGAPSFSATPTLSTIYSPASTDLTLNAASNTMAVKVTSTAASTSSTTGSLIVSGGMGVAGAINAAGAIATTSAMSANSDISTIQSTAATGNPSATNYSSPSVKLTGTYWDNASGGSSKNDTWSIQNVLGSGNNPNTTLTFSHSTGTSGTASVSMPSVTVGGSLTQTSTDTTGSAHSITANSLTSGSIMSLSSSSTAAAAGNTGLNIAISGTNGTGGITRYGLKSSMTSAGGTSTNVAGYFSATGGTTANYGLIVENGSVGIGTTAPLDLLSFGTVNGSATRASLNLSNTALSGGSASGTYIGANPAAAGADFINYQVNGTSKFKVDSAGNVTATSISGNSSTATTATNLAGGSAGSIPYQSGAGSTSMLGIGSSGYVLTSTGSAPQWSQTIGVANGGTNNASLTTTAGGILYMDGTKVMASAVGTSGQALISGGGAAPTWSNVSLSGNNVTIPANGNITMASGSGKVGIGTTSPTSSLHIANAQTASAWGVAGISFNDAAATYTDSSTAASTTVATVAKHSVGIPTFAATNASVTYTDAYNTYIAGAPTKGTNATFTNAYGLYIDTNASTSTTTYGLFAKAQTGGTTANYAAAFTGGNVGIGTTTPGVSLDLGSTTDALRLPNGTNAQRPTAVANGQIRYNSNGGAVEIYQNSTWNTPINVVTTKIISASGNYTVPAGLVYAIVEVVGGGGGGGGVSAVAGAAAGGGGAGGYAKAFCTPGNLGATFGTAGTNVAVTIGTAGTAGANTGATGGNGSSTTFGTTLLIGGGGNGGGGSTTANTAKAGGTGGTASVATCTQIIANTGSKGFAGYGTTVATSAFSGQGASSPLGTGGTDNVGLTGAGGSAGGYGAGGGGALGATANIGGAGSAGVVIITEYRAY